MEHKKERNGGTPGIDSLPSDLIRSLRVLGLSNYEAKVYAALVLFDHAEAKEITDFLSLSKPSVYEALESLAEKGLTVRQSSKPARFSAVSPDMAIGILLEDHEKASKKALAALKRLEQKKVRSDMENIVWTIYGDANIKYKIQEMFGKAKTHISCTMGDRYVQFLDNVRPAGVPLRLTIFSSSPGLEERMREKFPSKNARVRIIPLERFTSPPSDYPLPEIAEVWGFLEFGNVLELNVDDEELLWSPAFISGVGSVLNTQNKGAIIYLKLFSRLFWKRVYGDDAIDPPPAKETKRTGRRKSTASTV
jgi:sugar-specific transcriptional regulator TrmB